MFHRLTALAGRRGASGETWTNWYSVGERLPGPLRKWYQILKLAHMRETLFENNLVRPYPEGVKTGYVDGDPEPPVWARRWRSADGSWNYLLKDADGRYDPMVGAAYTRFFRNVGDDRGLAGIQPPEDPATDPVSVRELSRRLLTSTGERRTIPFLNLWAAAWIQFQNARLGEPRLQRLDPDGPDPARGGRPATRVRRRPPHHPPERPGPDPAARGRRAAADLPERGHPLVGRLAALRQRLGDPAQGALAWRAAGSPSSDDGTLPVDAETGTELTGFSRNWWVGLGLLHTVFAREHNAICDMLRGAPPDLGRRDPVPDRPAGQRRGDGQDPHHRVDAGHPAEPLAQRRR